MSKLYDLFWKGEQVMKATEAQLERIMLEAALTAEGEAKKELRKGHGVITGTLRRSIHVAQTDYAFSQDDVEPDASTPERGGKEVKPVKEENKFKLALGSGLKYALKVHQGWGKFGGYHFLTIGVDRAKETMKDIIERNRVHR